MKPLVDLQAPSPGVALLAPIDLADERLLMRVGHLVGLEMPFGDESVFALLAFERTFSSMHSHVSFEITRLRELLQALLVGAEEHPYLVAFTLDLLNVCKRG